ncbi:MAG TPA: type III pantothenate kinase [Ignavibacteriaceae bacterium]|nr:type III pantothenate kinase [Ignavibacteriaceae bacterium]
MIAFLDIGNSRIKYAFGNESEISNSGFVNSISELNQLFYSNNIEKVIFSSVNPAISHKVENISEESGIEKVEITINSNLGIKINYETPHTLGIDRVCGIVGAKSILENKNLNDDLIVTVDCGTATTINILYKNNFVGGFIAPGLTTMFKSLNQNTSLLPELDNSSFSSFIGKNTNDSISAGVFSASIGYIKFSVSKIEEEFGIQPRLLFTGGNAEIILKNSKIDAMFVDDLVLRGVMDIYKRSQMEII